MKKIFLFAAALMVAISLNAQTFNFSDFEVQDGINAGTTEINGLGFYACAEGKTLDKDGKTQAQTNFGIIEEHEKTWKQSEGFEETFKGTKRLKTNGGAIDSKTGELLQRYLYFDVDKACTVQVWYEAAGASSRYAVVSDGTTETRSDELTASGAFGVLKAQIAAAGTVYVYGTNGMYIYQIKVSDSDAGQGIDAVEDAVKAEKYFRNGQLIIRKNGVEYNALGAQL